MNTKAWNPQVCRWAAFAIALSLAACSKNPADVIERAKAHRAKGDNAAAAIELKSILAEQPKNAEVFFLAGSVLADMGDLVNAENALRRALQLGRPAADVLPALGRVLLDLEKFPEALEALKTNPKSEVKLEQKAMVELTLLRGRAYVGLGELVPARTEFLLVMNERPVQAKLGLARIAIADNDFSGAEKVIAEVMGMQASSAEALLLRAEIFRVQEKFDEAKAVYDQLVKLEPNNPRALLNLATLMLVRDQIEAAKPLLDRGEKLEPAGPLLRFAKGLLAYKEKRYLDAEVQLRALFEMMPKHYPGLLLAGTVAYATGKYDLAQNAFGTYVLRFPGNLPARRMLGATLLAKGQPQLAVTVVEPVMAKARDAGFLGMGADAFRQVGRPRIAKSLLDRAIEIDPKSPELRTGLGLVELALGSRPRAIASFEAAIALNPVDARADEALVVTLIRQQQLDRAQAVADALEKRLPKLPDANALKGAILVARKEDAKAREFFERSLQLDPMHFPAAEALSDMDAREGKPAARRQRMEAILKKDAHHLGALLALAKIDITEGKQAQGVAAIRRAISEHPESINALLMLAEIQMRGGQLPEAVISARQARDAHPYDTRALSLLAEAQLATGDKQGAIQSYTSLVAMQAQVPDWHLKLAGAHMVNGDLKSAAQAVAQAVSIDPGSVGAKALNGELLLQTGQVAQALQLAAQMQKENPKLSIGYKLEGDALFARKDYAKALPQLQKAASLGPTGEVWVKIHQAQRALAGGKASDAALLDWLKKHPDDINTRFYLADSYTAAARLKEAVEQYQMVLKRVPSDFRVLNNLAWALHLAGDGKALDYAEQARKLNPKDAATADTFGMILLSRGKNIEAMQVLLEAVGIDGDNPEIRYHLVQALLKVGDTVRARSELKILVTSGKPFPQLEEARALAAKLGA